MALCGTASAEQASEPGSPAAGHLDAGGFHSCVASVDAGVLCWGLGVSGQLGYGNTASIGDDETPASVGSVTFGDGRTAKAIAAGDYHSCALLDDGTVRCWGFGGDGRLGYGNTDSVSRPSLAGPVYLGLGRKAAAIAAGAAHTCAILDDASLLCWGFGGGGLRYDYGRLGYGNTDNVGDDETPGSVGAVKLGAGHTARGISAGDDHTCVVLDDGGVKCWGRNGFGQLGYGNTSTVGDTPSTTPDTVGPVDLGGHRAVAVSGGGAHTCAVLDDGTVRCWGFGASGQLGYGKRDNIGDDELPDSAGPVRLGLGRSAAAISAGGAHTCALLDNGAVRCWGLGDAGRLGYGNQNAIGDNELPDTVGPVDLGSGRSAAAISAGGAHTCALLDDGTVRCWGNGANGRLGYCNQVSIGDDETPGSAGPVNLEPGDGGPGCPPPGPGTPTVGPAAPSPLAASGPTPPMGGGTIPAVDPDAASGPTPPMGGGTIPAVDPDAARGRRLLGCLAEVRAHARHETRLAQRGSARERAIARRHLRRHESRGRRRCLHLYGRIPGPVTGLRARALANAVIALDFDAAGTDGSRPPVARRYVVVQSLRPIRTARDFARAQILCAGACSFDVTDVGARLKLTVTGLRPRTTYYYALAARDNVSGRCGPRSRTAKATTTDAGPPEPPSGGGDGHAEPPPPPRHRRLPSCQALG